jgi:hypothetical protein
MEKDVIIQKWGKTIDNELEMGRKYYSLLSVVHNLKLTEREIELLSFTSSRGTISSPSSKGEFCRRFNSSVPTVNNMISRLKRLGYLIKTNSKTTVNPKIDLDFSKDVIIRIELNGSKREDSE